MATPARPSDGRPTDCRPADDLAGRPVVQDDKPPAIDSRTLLAGHRELRIEHGSEVYRLRLTSNNKLILIK